jgi:hypothetical protein
MGASGIRLSGGFGGSRSVPGGIGPKSTVRMDMSVTSVQSIGSNANPARGAFIGERTIAAYVVRDNYRSSRDEIAAAGTSPKDVRRFGKYRRLWLEVMWQKSSNEACKRYELKPGSVIERQQAHLEQFEVFRCPWKNESRRRSLREEWANASDSFLQTDC